MVAERSNRAKDLFLATLSHELRTPLSAIVGWLRILQCPDLGEMDLAEGLAVIDRNVQAQVHLINDILDVSRIVSGKLQLEIGTCDLAQILKEGVDAVRPAAATQGITLDMQLDHLEYPVECDAVRIQQVVWNLLSNAVKFTPKGGRICVTMQREQSIYRIQVSDDGQGITADLLPYIFDRFRQADSCPRRHYGGLGLGLSIVKYIVEQHGGTVDVHSEGEGLGATFDVRLPVHAVQIDEHGQTCGGLEHPTIQDVPAASRKTHPRGVRLDGLGVLVIEDTRDARRPLVRFLERAGAVVTAAGSVAKAMALLSASKPDVLISDMAMPGKDGYDLIRKVRASGLDAKNLPAIALSAFAHKQDQERSLSAGFQLHIVKPVEPDHLVFAIASLMGRTAKSQSSEF